MNGSRTQYRLGQRGDQAGRQAQVAVAEAAVGEEAADDGAGAPHAAPAVDVDAPALEAAGDEPRADRQARAVLVGIGVVVGLARAAPGEGDGGAAEPFASSSSTTPSTPRI